MNPITFFQLLCSLIILGAGVFVLIKDYRSRINQIFFLMCSSTTLWLSYCSIMFWKGIEHTEIPFFVKLSYCGITFIPVFVNHFSCLFTNNRYIKKILPFTYSYAFLSCFLILKTKFIIKDIKHFSWGPYPQAGIFHPIYLTIFIGIIIHTVLTLFYSLKDPRRYSSKSVQEKHILLLGFMLFSLGSLDFIPNYGISMRPLGFIPATIFIFIFAYAIIKHHILDINLFIKKGIIYSFLIVFITFLYFALILIAEKILQGIVGYRSFSISVLTAFTLGILFIPLRNKIQYFVDRIFYRGSQEEIARENELLRQELAQTEKLKAVAALASGMSHEIKNPLTAIKTFTEYLPEKKDDKEFLDKFAKIVGKEVDRIDDIVHQLLEFAKPSPFSFKETNIHKLLDETIDFLNSKLIKNKIKILKKYSENSAPLEADPGKLKQAFLNILLNAIEAMPIGGILEIHTESNSDKLTISIVDIGPGISKKDLKNIFDPFYTKKDGGTGLGLSITQRIISEHNGRIWAESKTGQGAKFVIELPL